MSDGKFASQGSKEDVIWGDPREARLSGFL